MPNTATTIATVFLLSVYLSTSNCCAQDPPNTNPFDQKITPDNPKPASDEIHPTPVIPLHNDPNEPETPAWNPSQQFWTPQYHNQVNNRTFMILNYPYHKNGDIYPNLELLKNPDMPDEALVKIDNLNKTRYYLEKCCDAVHQWRSINESPNFSLEIVRAVELTRTSSGIYNVSPKNAVQIKRAIGRIGKINKNFNEISRLAIIAIIYDNEPKAYLARMDKHLADLKARAAHLAEENDLASIALGLGKFLRNTKPAANQQIKFSRVQPITPK